MLNIVIPMAGLGSRFAAAGYTVPKPLIVIHGVPMIRLVTENIRPLVPHRFIYICQRTHVEAYGLDQELARWAQGCAVVAIDGLTEGAACTVLAARDFIGSDEPLMITNSDQYVDIGIDAYIEAASRSGIDGMIMTMQASDRKWSYAALDAGGLVTRVAEKEPISTYATVGIYNFRSGKAFLAAAERMIAKNLRVNGEFYVAPVYNELIADGARIAVYDIGTEGSGMYGLGIPEDLDCFVAHPISRRATADLS